MSGDDNMMVAEVMTLNKGLDLANDCCFIEVIFETNNDGVVILPNLEEKHNKGQCYHQKH